MYAKEEKEERGKRPKREAMKQVLSPSLSLTFPTLGFLPRVETPLATLIAIRTSCLKKKQKKRKKRHLCATRYFAS